MKTKKRNAAPYSLAAIFVAAFVLLFILVALVVFLRNEANDKMKAEKTAHDIQLQIDALANP